MFRLAKGYKERGMAAYSELQQAEFASEAEGYTATRHQREVGTGWFDAVAVAASGGRSSTTAMAGSTETEQFHDEGQAAPMVPQTRAAAGGADAACPRVAASHRDEPGCEERQVRARGRASPQLVAPAPAAGVTAAGRTATTRPVPAG